MSGALTIRIEKPIVSVKVLDDYSDCAGGKSSDGGTADLGSNTTHVGTPDAEFRKTAFSQACQALNQIAAKLQELYNNAFVEHRAEIARLSVEIARKILMQKVENGDYEIESIVTEALLHAPSHQDVVVHLNPQDLAECLKAQRDEQSGDLIGVKLVPDPNIGRAECLLESPKGIVKSLIDENLDRVGKALVKAG
jgi:flagellar biosynthesis/type III secretory pathway protein FliH